MAGATGVGERSPSSSGLQGGRLEEVRIAANKPNPFSLPKLEAMKKAAIDEVNSNAAKLRVAAFAARDAAKKAGDLKKNPLTKSAGAIFDQIEKAADFMGVGANGNSLGGYIAEGRRRGKNAFDTTAKAIRPRSRARSRRSERHQGGRRSDHAQHGRRPT